MALTVRQSLIALAFSGLLQACVQQPVSNEPTPVTDAPNAPDTSPEPVPELTLNLPKGERCNCPAPAGETDYTFLERGYDALSRGEDIEAVQYFQRYQRLESSPAADWEARIAIAYVSMLPRSPFFDPEAARKSYKELNKLLEPGMQVHQQSLLMRDSLETFVVMDRHIADLESNNDTLKEDLQKREEALRRLRELTLGQKAGRQ